MQIRHWFRCAVVAVAALTMTNAAFARPDTRNMTCAQTMDLIDQSGAVVLSTGRHTYDRFVSDRGRQCTLNEMLETVYVPTRDGSCPLYHCVRFEIEDWR